MLAACSTYAEGVAAITELDADVLITDLKLPDGHGPSLIKLARKTCPTMEIMVISVLGDDQSVVTAIASGASGFLLKDSRSLDIAHGPKDVGNTEQNPDSLSRRDSRSTRQQAPRKASPHGCEKRYCGFDAREHPENRWQRDHAHQQCDQAIKVGAEQAANPTARVKRTCPRGL